MLYKEFSTTNSKPFNNITKLAQDELFKRVCMEREAKISLHFELPNDKEQLYAIDFYKHANEDFLAKIKDILVIGIGGSSLGSKAIYTFLKAFNNVDSTACSGCESASYKNLHFLEHLDALKTREICNNISLESSLFVMISKSGATIESVSLFKYVLEHFNLLEHREHLLFISQHESPLHLFAKQNNIKCFSFDSRIGGRFSVLSYVGLLPLSLCGVNIENLLNGARDFFDRFFARECDFVLQKAIFLTQNIENTPDLVLFSYMSALSEFNAWCVQLFAESLGKVSKDGKRVGITPISLIGSIDQHSFLQLIMEGQRNKVVSFLCANPKAFRGLDISIPSLSLEGLEGCDFVNDSSFAQVLYKQGLASKIALQENGVACDYIEIDEINEGAIGELVAYYETLISSIGCALNINAYDQPAVEVGKKILKKCFKDF